MGLLETANKNGKFIFCCKKSVDIFSDMKSQSKKPVLFFKESVKSFISSVWSVRKTNLFFSLPSLTLTNN